MSITSIKEAVSKDYFRCPRCKGKLHLRRERKNETLICPQCNDSFPVFNNIPLFTSGGQGTVKEEIQLFWKRLYETVYKDGDESIHRKILKGLLEELGRLFQHRKHLAVNEMPIRHLKGKRVLEIGSGAGAHSAFFSELGANMFAMDITLERVLATANKFSMLNNNNENVCLQGDAEFLPFKDMLFDIVYSNGVLHHTPDTKKTIEEVHRVLKPNGKAIIMLYARDSLYYWLVLFLIKGILMGTKFRNRNWLGHVTEWMSNDPQTVYNQETKVFSKNQIYTLFRKFQTISIRKNSFVFQQIPFLGKKVSRLLTRKTGLNDAGKLLYGNPWRNETEIELLLGKHIGFALNILAKK